ncbi:MAG: ABC transporter ATP-binding protein [Phycisphaerales bacterium]
MTLTADRIEFGYQRGAPILRGVSATFEPGRIAAVLGPNGAGKSTLLRLLLGVAAPWSGSATLAGSPTASLRGSERARRLAFVPQRPTVSGSFTARQSIEFGRHALSHDPEGLARVSGHLELAPLLERPFARLSVGQQQRVALARALVQLGVGNSDLTGCALLADEPFSAMDPRFVSLAAMQLRAAARRGAAVIVVIHDATSALRLADDALLLTCDGGVAAFGPVGDTVTVERLSALFGAGFEAVGSGAILPEM